LTPERSEKGWAKECDVKGFEKSAERVRKAEKKYRFEESLRQT